MVGQTQCRALRKLGCRGKAARLAAVNWTGKWITNYTVLAEETPSQHPDAQVCSLKIKLKKKPQKRKKVIKKTKIEMRGGQGKRLLVFPLLSENDSSLAQTSHWKGGEKKKKSLHGQICTDNLNLKTLESNSFILTGVCLGCWTEQCRGEAVSTDTVWTV